MSYAQFSSRQCEFYAEYKSIRCHFNDDKVLHIALIHSTEIDIEMMLITTWIYSRSFDHQLN